MGSVESCALPVALPDPRWLLSLRLVEGGTGSLEDVDSIALLPLPPSSEALAGVSLGGVGVLLSGGGVGEAAAEEDEEEDDDDDGLAAAAEVAGWCMNCDGGWTCRALVALVDRRDRSVALAGAGCARTCGCTAPVRQQGRAEEALMRASMWVTKRKMQRRIHVLSGGKLLTQQGHFGSKQPHTGEARSI